MAAGQGHVLIFFAGPAGLLLGFTTWRPALRPAAESPDYGLRPLLRKIILTTPWAAGSCARNPDCGLAGRPVRKESPDYGRAGQPYGKEVLTTAQPADPVKRKS